MAEHRFCILIPTYNNSKTLKKVVSEIISIYPHLIVVNDGSTDDSEEILKQIDHITVINYSKNKGKGYALRKGFEKASEMGFDYAITIDSDGQHEPHNIADLVNELHQCEEPTIIMGSRNMDQDGIPKKSSFGNKFSSFWYWVETGIKLKDTQTGFRAYPLRPIEQKKWFTRKFEFEIEVIVRLAWSGIAIKEIPVQVHYPEDRVSHFRPFKDFTRISLLNTVLFTLAALYHAPKRFFFKPGPDNFFRKVKIEFSRHNNNPIKLSASIGLGLFFGILPIWGFQMLVAFFVASIFKLNRVLVLASSNISIPPFIPFIIFGSFFVGSFFVHSPASLPNFSDISISDMYLHLKQYLKGAIILAISVGLGGFIVSFLLLQMRKFK